MVARTLESQLRRSAELYPVVTVTGPRQSGKTTLCRSVFSQHAYVSLEDPSERELALADPKGFLARFRDGVILDEIQRAPQLTSYIQPLVDQQPSPGQYVLTGSQHFGLSQSISQSLAGRTAVLQLLPLGNEEVRRFPKHPQELDSTLRCGGYPRIHDQQIPPEQWLGDYVATYVERDVRQVINVGDLIAFQTFLRLCAGRSGQVINLSALGNDAGITHNTAKAWLSVLEASFLVFRLAPWSRNVNKRLIKTPKLYFYDTGLLCYLLGIRTDDHLRQHPLRGAIFETWCTAEVVKSLRHRGRETGLYFYRDQQAREIDLLVEDGPTLRLVEIKSGQTLASDFFSTLDTIGALLQISPGLAGVRKSLIYGGAPGRAFRDVEVLGWQDVADTEWLA